MMKKMAIASFAVLILGSSAALAQPYGYGNRYNYPTQNCANPNRAFDAEQYRRGHIENITICIKDPATDRPISAAQYQARYPWTDPTTWTYDPGSDLWGDHTREFANQYSRNDYREYPRDNRDNRYRRYRN